MVATFIKPPLLSARNTSQSDTTEQSDWGPLQIATPIIVGAVLLLVFGAYIIWRRDPLRRRSYDYLQVRPDWVSRIERMFVPRRRRLRVLHSSAPFTLDDSMHTASLRLDFRRAPYRSDSSDSQTPLTNYTFGYPPTDTQPDSLPPISKRRPLRWWWLFGSRPREVKPQEPDLRWRVDGPDGSSSGHGNSNHGHEEYRARFAGHMDALHEDREEIGDDVMPIGENFSSIASTPMTYHLPEQARAVQGMSPVPEFPGSSGARTPTAALQSNPGTPQFSANRGLPPSYDVSQSQTRFASMEDIVRQTRSDPPYMVIPPPVRTAGYTSPRTLHGRHLSSDSFLATQPPMVAATSIY